MNNLASQSLIAAACLLVHIIKGDNSFFELSTVSRGVTFKPNDSVVFKCTVLKSRTGVGDGIQWFRTQDSVSLMIATEIMANYDFYASGRYAFSRGSVTPSTADYYLTITNLQLEDSATIECGIPRFTQRASLAFAVCMSPDNEVCRCMTRTGWSSPACYDDLINAQQSLDYHRKGAIGLGFALAVMIIVSIILTVCVIKDCIQQTRMKKKKEQEEEARAPPLAVSLAPPGASVLKQRSHNGPSSNGAISSVHFYEDSAISARVPVDDHRPRTTSTSGPGPNGQFSDDGFVNRTPVNHRRMHFAGDIDDTTRQSYNNGGKLYPPINVGPSSFTQGYGYRTPMNGLENYNSAYQLPPPGYSQSYDAQNPQMPHAAVPFTVAVPRSEAFPTSRAEFVDPGSTSI